MSLLYLEDDVQEVVDKIFLFVVFA